MTGRKASLGSSDAGAVTLSVGTSTEILLLCRIGHFKLSYYVYCTSTTSTAVVKRAISTACTLAVITRYFNYKSPGVSPCYTAIHVVTYLPHLYCYTYCSICHTNTRSCFSDFLSGICAIWRVPVQLLCRINCTFSTPTETNMRTEAGMVLTVYSDLITQS